MPGKLSTVLRAAVVLLTLCVALHAQAAEISRGIVPITDSNADDLLNEGEWMVAFTADWCGFCKRLDPEWENFAAKGLVHVGEVDIEKQKALAGRFLITGLPTIFHIKDGEIRLYDKARSTIEFIDFVTRKQWKTITPYSPLTSPLSIHFQLLGWVFRLGGVMQELYDTLTKTYQLSQPVVLAIFCAAVIVSGILFAIVLLVVGGLLSFLFGSRTSPQAAAASTGTSGSPKAGGASSSSPPQAAEAKKQK